VTDFALEEPVGLTLEVFEAGLLGAGKDQLKLGLGSVCGLRVIPKVSSMKVGYSRLI